MKIKYISFHNFLLLYNQNFGIYCVFNNTHTHTTHARTHARTHAHAHAHTHTHTHTNQICWFGAQETLLIFYLFLSIMKTVFVEVLTIFRDFRKLKEQHLFQIEFSVTSQMSLTFDKFYAFFS